MPTAQRAPSPGDFIRDRRDRRRRRQRDRHSIADGKPPVSEHVERREVAGIVTHLLLSVARARTVWAMRYRDGPSTHEVVAALGSRTSGTRVWSSANRAINRK